MKEKYVLYGGLFILALVAIINYSPVVRAITPTGPGLYDANGVYMGQLLSTYNSEDDNGGMQGLFYTTYLPAVDGILQFKSDINGTGHLFDNFPSDILYDQPDCQGTAYVYAEQSGGTWIHPWIVARTNGDTFKVSSTTLTIDILSDEQPTNATPCTNGDQGSIQVHKLKPVTLPFNIDSIALPYKITTM